MEIEQIYTYFIRSSSIATDTRKISPNSLFFCLKGTQFNGNKFAKEAIKKGASYVIVDDPDYYLNNEKYILVQNSLETLQKLAQYHRRKFSIPIIALTGSNGKTTTKELIDSVLSQQFITTTTPGNFNNHIGVPLTLLNINAKTEIAIIEMGASHLNEIAFLSSLAEPTHGYITNFGKAHLEGFGSIERVIQGKSELFNYLKLNDGVVIINSSEKKMVTITKNQKVFSFGTLGNVNVLIKNKIQKNQCLSFIINNQTIDSNLKGVYNRSNIAAAITFGVYFKIPLELIKKGVKKYIPKNNRSQWLKTDNNTLILDAYNANPSSMKSALDAFFETQKNGVLILGDMLELGQYALEEHQKIVDFISIQKTFAILLIGTVFNQTSTDSKITKFTTTEEAAHYLQKNNFYNKTILIKGSRGIALETLQDYL